jgi:hypothetical protein
MPKRIAIALGKFAALTLWIGFVALSVENLFRTSTWDERNMVEKCQMEANKRYQDDLNGWAVHYFRGTGYKHVMLVPRDQRQKSRYCLFRHDLTFYSIF